jgi:hypothetical protein
MVRIKSLVALLVASCLGITVVEGQTARSKLGDAYFFSLPNATLKGPQDPSLWYVFGKVPPGDYHVVFTGMLQWSDPANSPATLRNIGAALDLDAFDDSGNLIQTWNSDVYVRVSRTYMSAPDLSGSAPQTAHFTEQTVIHVPAGYNLALMQLGSPDVVLVGGRFVLTRVSIP